MHDNIHVRTQLALVQKHFFTSSAATSIRPWSGLILTVEAVKSQTPSQEYEISARRQGNSEKI